MVSLSTIEKREGFVAGADKTDAKEDTVCFTSSPRCCQPRNAATATRPVISSPMRRREVRFADRCPPVLERLASSLNSSMGISTRSAPSTLFRYPLVSNAGRLAAGSRASKRRTSAVGRIAWDECQAISVGTLIFLRHCLRELHAFSHRDPKQDAVAHFTGRIGPTKRLCYDQRKASPTRDLTYPMVAVCRAGTR